MHIRRAHVVTALAALLMASSAAADPVDGAPNTLQERAEVLDPAEVEHAEPDTAEHDTAEHGTAEPDTSEPDTSARDAAPLDHKRPRPDGSPLEVEGPSIHQEAFLAAAIGGAGAFLAAPATAGFLLGTGILSLTIVALTQSMGGGQTGDMLSQGIGFLPMFLGPLLALSVGGVTAGAVHLAGGRLASSMLSGLGAGLATLVILPAAWQAVAAITLAGAAAVFLGVIIFAPHLLTPLVNKLADPVWLTWGLVGALVVATLVVTVIGVAAGAGSALLAGVGATAGHFIDDAFEPEPARSVGSYEE